MKGERQPLVVALTNFPELTDRSGWLRPPNGCSAVKAVSPTTAILPPVLASGLPLPIRLSNKQGWLAFPVWVRLSPSDTFAWSHLQKVLHPAYTCNLLDRPFSQASGRLTIDRTLEQHLAVVNDNLHVGGVDVAVLGEA